jgi:hypothetical protein
VQDDNDHDDGGDDGLVADDPTGAPVDRLAPGRSVNDDELDDPPGEAGEPNEPA